MGPQVELLPQNDSWELDSYGMARCAELIWIWALRPLPLSGDPRWVDYDYSELSVSMTGATNGGWRQAGAGITLYSYTDGITSNREVWTWKPAGTATCQRGWT